MKFKPPDLLSNPSPEKWKWWKKCCEDDLRINDTTKDADKLVFFRTLVGSDYLTLLENSATFADALRSLSRQFLKNTRVLLERHRMLNASQKDDKSIVQFSGSLKLIEDCESTSLTVQAHKDYLVRDALISLNIRAQVWRHSSKTVGAGRLQVRHRYRTIQCLFEIFSKR